MNGIDTDNTRLSPETDLTEDEKTAEEFDSEFERTTDFRAHSPTTAQMISTTPWRTTIRSRPH